MARVAIVDYGMGNLFSVAHACEHVGLDAAVTPDAGRFRLTAQDAGAFVPVFFVSNVS